MVITWVLGSNEIGCVAADPASRGRASLSETLQKNARVILMIWGGKRGRKKQLPGNCIIAHSNKGIMSERRGCSDGYIR